MQFFIKLQRMSVLFWLRKNVVNSSGESPLYYRVTIDGIRGNNRSTGIKLRSIMWSAKKQKCKSNTLFNEKIYFITSKVQKIHHYLELTGKKPTPQLIYDYLDGKKKNHTILEMFDFFISDCHSTHLAAKKKGIPPPLKKITIATYGYKRENILEYLTSNNRVEYMINSVDAVFCSDFTNWLLYKSKVKMERSYIARHITVLKKVVQFAYGKGYLSRNKIKDFVYSRGRAKEPINLSLSDVNRIWQYPFTGELQNVAHLFLLQCFTGLEFKDFERICFDNIETIKGRFYFVYDRAKNGNKAVIPVGKELEDLLKQYKKPAFALAFYNQQLKRVGDKAGIETNLTMRIGRKTFHHLKVNEELYSPAAVAVMMGHKKVDTGRHYSRPSIELVVNETNKRANPLLK